MSGLSDSATGIGYCQPSAVASVLVMANLNSVPLDWVARCSVGGTNVSFFIVKQLPVLRPEAYLESCPSRYRTFAEVIAPLVLELIYTSSELAGLAQRLGYFGEPFTWIDSRRHKLKSELDAIYAHMYGLERDELDWILDPCLPSVSFNVLKKDELNRFGEYRTKRLVLHAYDQMATGGIS